MENRDELSNLVEEHVKEAMKQGHNELLQQIGTMMEKISYSSCSPRLSMLELPKFKRKSNEEQFKYNMKVQTCIEQTESSLDAGNIQESKAKLIEGKFRQLLKYIFIWF